MEKYNHIYIGWLREPRGHADMHAAAITPSADEADLDITFSQYRGYSPMCGPRVLAIARAMLEFRMTKKQALEFNTPAGRTYVQATLEDGEGTAVC